MTEQTFFLSGPLPGLNEVIAAAKRRRGSTWNGYAALKHRCQTAIWQELLVAKVRPMHRVLLTFTWIERSRRRDRDNIAAGKKFILDALVAANILLNDGPACVVGWTDAFVIDATTPGVWVTLREVP
jgi:hypothetical protein